MSAKITGDPNELINAVIPPERAANIGTLLQQALQEDRLAELPALQDSLGRRILDGQTTVRVRLPETPAYDYLPLSAPNREWLERTALFFLGQAGEDCEPAEASPPPAPGTIELPDIPGILSPVRIERAATAPSPLPENQWWLDGYLFTFNHAGTNQERQKLAELYRLCCPPL